MIMLFLSRIIEGESTFDTQDERHIQVFAAFGKIAEAKVTHGETINEMEHATWCRFVDDVSRNTVLNEKIDEAVRTRHNHMDADSFSGLKKAQKYIFQTSYFGRVTGVPRSVVA